MRIISVSPAAAEDEVQMIISMHLHLRGESLPYLETLKALRCAVEDAVENETAVQAQISETVSYLSHILKRKTEGLSDNGRTERALKVNCFLLSQSDGLCEVCREGVEETELKAITELANEVRPFLKGIPEDLHERAYLDACVESGIAITEPNDLPSIMAFGTEIILGSELFEVVSGQNDTEQRA